MNHARLLLLCLALFVTAIPTRAEAPAAADYRPDPAAVQHYGPAYRYPQAGWTVLHIEGQPYERGYQHGRLMAPEIAAHLRCWAAILTPKAPTDGWQHTRRLTNALFVRRFTQEYLEEMKGIADGASEAGARFDNRPLDLVDVVALNCWPEIETLDSALEATPTGLEGLRFPHAQPRAKPKPRPEHCSAFAATGPATADGKVVFGHITMFSLYPASFYNVWLDVKPAKGHRVLMCAYPGAIQSGMDYYMNDAGLLIAETTIAQTRFNIHGQTETSRIRQAAQYAGTIDEAVAILKKDNNGLYSNEWLLADVNSNEIALLELGTDKTRLHRSSKNEWIGGTTGFYWGCNNTKDVELRLETVASVKGRPANVVFRPSNRDRAWQQLYHKHKGKIGVAFGKEAFTTPPIASFASLDAKFTTTDLAKELKSWALFGPPLGRTWQPTQGQRQQFPEIKPLVSNPWTLLHGAAPAAAQPKTAVAVDLPRVKSAGETTASRDRKRDLLNVPAWHGTLLPQGGGDVWLAAAFADYERIAAREKAMRARRDEGDLSQEDRDALAVDLFAYRSAYQSAARAGGDVPLLNVQPSLVADEWYRVASGKGVLLLHELRRQLGDAAFEETMNAFGREHAGQKVTTAQFRAHVEQRAGKPLNGFFDSWLKQTQLPALRLGKATYTQVSREGPSSSSAFTIQLRGEILQDMPELRPLKVDVTVETEQAGEVTKTVELKGPRTEFTLDRLPGQPTRVVLDKYGNTARADAAAFSVLSFQQEPEQTLIVYGTGDELPTNREAAESLQKAIRESGANHTLPIKSDREVTEADLKSNHLLLVGRPDSNALVARFRKALPTSFGSRSFVVRGKTYANPGSALVVAADNPLNKRYSVVVVAGLSPESMLSTAPFVRRGQRGAEVLVLPQGGPAQALALPAQEVVPVLSQR